MFSPGLRELYTCLIFEYLNLQIRALEAACRDGKPTSSGASDVSRSRNNITVTHDSLNSRTVTLAAEEVDLVTGRFGDHGRVRKVDVDVGDFEGALSKRTY